MSRIFDVAGMQRVKEELNGRKMSPENSRPSVSGMASQSVWSLHCGPVGLELRCVRHKLLRIPIK